MRRKKILIADDSPVVVDMLTFMLSSLSCDILTATNGVDAIQLSYSKHPDLILLDILMPRMNGYQVCRLLKDDEATKHIPIVMLTAKDQRSDRFWGMTTGADDYIVKDFENDRLLETIERFLRQETPPHVTQNAEKGLQEITTIDVLSHANDLLDRQLFQSTITNRINQLARSIQNFEETLRSVFDLLGRILTFQLGAISILNTRGTQLRLYFYIAERVGQAMFEQSKHDLMNQFSRVSSLKNVESVILHGEISLECTSPLHSKCESVLTGRNTKIGTIMLADSRKGRFSDDDRETFRIAGSEVAVVLDNARLYDENARIFTDLERELRRAYDIQCAMLPQANPMEALLTIEATSMPAQEVGGDYYDFYPLNDHRLLVAIGDVTGKGVPAALLMAMIKTALQVQIELTQNVREILAALNRLVRLQAPRQYMTLFLGIVDLQTQTITYCNAGHNFPLVVSVSDEALAYLDEESFLPLGFLEEPEYHSCTRHFKNDDLLFFYTDGIVEARNEKRELYGFPRLEQLLLTYCHEELVTVYLKLLESLEAFCHETPQDDDMTLMFLQKSFPQT